MGIGDWGLGTGDWGLGDKGDKGYSFPIFYAQCAIPNAPYPMRHTQCAMPNAPCPMRHAPLRPAPCTNSSSRWDRLYNSLVSINLSLSVICGQLNCTGGVLLGE
ncbi:hypothetical protein [Nostoc sp. CMAA1605]|uniref:hypothetical protein n=1 Tax=Nostoc sp. CMAA1605 TaxID=2055159 RepID=UPI001F30CB32|nr:hypothetical protein [Nostoc sp. CMAA1605]